jgi:hypothetical protein
MTFNRKNNSHVARMGQGLKYHLSGLENDRHLAKMNLDKFEIQ